MIEGREAPGESRRSDEGARGRLIRVALGAVLLVAALVVPGTAVAVDLPPHVTTEEGPDACAMCHRAHTAPGVVARSQSGSWDTTGSALVIANPLSNAGDAALCLTCHGIEGFGSQIVVQDDFLRDSAHTLLPDASRYEEVPEKQCSSCHDAHGSEKRADGTPYPGLLRALTELGEPFYEGEQYCATCHYDARDEYDNRFDGLSIYEQTAHFGLPDPASGTQITCSNCHASHGSDVAPLIAAEIVPPVVAPAVPETATITANDRTLCYACHAVAQATWLGAEVYDDEATETVHGSSDIALPVTAEYASEETTRLAGECQSCHNPMGSDNGDGSPIAKLAELEGRALCYACHNANNAKVVTDMASFGVFPEDIDGEPELVVAWDPANLPAAYGGLHVYTRAFGDDTAPYDLEGPRRYRVANGMDGRTGSMAYGDIDASGETALVVADPASPVLRVFRTDPLAGLSYTSHSIEETATYIEIGEFIVDGAGLPEVAAVSIEAAGASYLRLYRYNGSGFTLVAGPEYVGDYASGLAAGDLTGGDVADLVVTALTGNPLGAGELRVLSAVGGALTSSSAYMTRTGPRGPSIGNVWLASAETTEIVVANSGETVDTLSVFSSAGVELASYEATISPGGAVAWDTAIGDILPGVGTVEVAVALRGDTSASGVSVFRTVAGNGLVAHDTYETGDGYATSALEIGDIDGDGQIQLVVGNAGVLSRTTGESVSPSAQAFRANAAGDSMSVAITRWGGGTELAGGTPAVAVVDLGPVGRSRHPASAIEGAHVSTETAGLERHAECVDCHNVHAAAADEPNPLYAPSVYGAVRGTWGVDAFSAPYVPVEDVDYEYQMCFKCHADSSWGNSPRDIAAELDPAGNQGFHSVVAPSPFAQNNTDTFVTGWTVDSQMYCVSCHGNAGAGPDGPHVSSQAPLLDSPYIGTRPAASGLLCYSCHKQTVYYDGTEDSPTPVSGSLFYDAETSTTGTLLHQKHVYDHGLSCDACHVSHGGTDHMIRDDIDWIHHPSNGSGCFTECHDYSTAHVYSRIPEYENPSAFEVQAYDTFTGDLASIQTQDGNLLVVRELNGAPPVSRIQIDFHPVYFPLASIPTSLEIYGYYDGGNQNHLVQVEAYNWDTLTWDVIGTLPKATTAGQYTYPIMAGAYLSNDDRVRVRIDHKDNGNQNHYLYLDRVWLRH
ncbi:MAG: cytochrome c3 family protein [Anaerosomatales bacterium]|nr:cytochrome c3 family protein [Anaerosomatales bacterium]MDT8434085.1 cytochrome c3 family protein [Anaerosomatales bacterium]